MMSKEPSNQPDVAKTRGSKSKLNLSSFMNNETTKPVILASTGQVRPLYFNKKKKLPRYKVFLKKISETSESEVSHKTNKEPEEDDGGTQNHQPDITHVKSTAKSLVKAAEKLCLTKDLKPPVKIVYDAAPRQSISRHSGLEKLKDTWRFPDSEEQAPDIKDLINVKTKSTEQIPKLDLLKNDDHMETMTVHQKILMDMASPISVTKEDILNLKEAFVKVIPKAAEKEKIPTPLEKSEPRALKKMKEEIVLKSSKIKQISKVPHHNFCGATNEVQIPSPFTKASWRYHTPSKYQTHFPIKSCRESITMNRLLNDDGGTTLTANIMMDCDFNNDLNELKSNAEKLLCDLQFTIEGNEVPTMVNDDMYFWTLSPPKLNITPKHVKKLMFPLYHQSQGSDILRYRKIEKAHRFVPTFSILTKKDSQKRYIEDELSGAESHGSGYSLGENTPQLASSESLVSKETVTKVMADDKGTTPIVNAETREKIEVVEMFHSVTDIESQQEPPGTLQGSLSTDNIYNIEKTSREKEERERFHSPFDVDFSKSLASSLPDTEKMSWEGSERNEDRRVQTSIDIESFLKPPVTLETTLSADNVYNVDKMSQLHPLMVESEPAYFDIETLSKQKGKPSDLNIELWIKEIWDGWCHERSTIKEVEYAKLNLLQYTFSPKSTSDIAFDDFLKSAVDIEFNISDCQTLTEEIEYLSKKIFQRTTYTIDDIYKRGVLYLKIGDFEASLEDLNRVIEEDYNYMGAYWHRHLIYIHQKAYLLALDDLIFLAEETKNYKIYMALGLVYANLEEPTMSIDNFSKAIECKPSDDLAYLYRAQLYQIGGYIQAAISDYKNVIELNPFNSAIILKHATLSIKIRKWNLALADFDKLIEMSFDTNYILQRAKIYIELMKFNLALKDLCDAIHHDPNFWAAYYLRGYLLKRCNQKQALSDFSLSLLLNDKEDNLSCYYQRGILYIKLGLIHQAISDFHCMITFQPNHTNALLSLGHIYSNYIHNFNKALKYYTNVINLEPTCTRGYFYRAQTYQKLENYTNALKDYIIIIHMQPNNYKCYLHLGYINLKLGNFAQSHDFLSLAAEKSFETGIGLTSEMAMVQLFLGNISTALDILKYNITKNPCSIPLLQLLAKVQIVDFRYREALQTYFLIKDIMRPEKKAWPEEADELFFNIGRVHMKIEEYEEALVAFNQALKINRTHKEAFYYRGIVKLHMNMCDFIRDFNKSLASNRRNAQVYLSRACYFGLLKNYPKAILNCNEALEIEPKSVKALLYRGALKYFIGAYKFAVIDLTEAIKINSNVAVTFLNRAICYAACGKKAKALRDYAIALLIGGKMDYKAYINRGLLYYSLNDIPNAYNDFKSALKIYGGDHKVFHILGLILHRLDRLDVAVKLFSRSIILQPTFQEALISRANVHMDYLTDTNNQLARCDYQRAIKLNPTNCLAYVSLGIFLQVERNFQLAWHQFTNAILINPCYQPAYEARAILNLQMGNKYPAFQDLTIALEISPTAELFNNRGVVNQMMNAPAAALHDYYKAIETDRTFALAYFNAASLHLQGRFFKQALEYFNRAIMLDTQNECAYINRAITKVMLKDQKGAFADFETAITLCPYYTHVFYNRGSLYLSLKMYEMAEKDFTSALKMYPSDISTLLRRAEARRELDKYNLALSDYKYAIMLMTNTKKSNFTDP